jgi:hypothetical protein
VGRPLWREDGSVFCICCWPEWPYFTVSDLRLPFSLPPTTRRVTVEVFDPASTRVSGVGLSQSQNQSYVTTNGQSASLSWCQAPICGLRSFCPAGDRIPVVQPVVRSPWLYRLNYSGSRQERKDIKAKNVGYQDKFSLTHRTSVNKAANEYRTLIVNEHQTITSWISLKRSCYTSGNVKTAETLMYYCNRWRFA